jgi:nicotinamide mononucleotide transporter
VIVSTLEVLAVILGLACVGLTVRQHIACWPTGLAMVGLYIVVFYRARLYADMLLQVVYVVLQLYGWHAWVRGGPRRSGLEVSRLPWRAAVAWSIVCAVGTAALGTVMHLRTDASLPYLDAFATNASLIAQWLLGRKVLESWLVWIVVDVFSIGMYLMKDLYLTAALYAVFLALSVQGYRAWSRTRAVPAMG